MPHTGMNHDVLRSPSEVIWSHGYTRGIVPRGTGEDDLQTMEMHGPMNLYTRAGSPRPRLTYHTVRRSYMPISDYSI